jgi:hypothetical protein
MYEPFFGLWRLEMVSFFADGLPNVAMNCDVTVQLALSTVVGCQS